MKRLIPILMLFTVACTTEHLPRDPERLVVEGWIDSGGEPVVMVTSPVTATEVPQGVDDLAQHMYYKAYVTVLDENTGQEVTLTARKDSRYLPPLIYTTDEMKGVPGHRYTLKVMYGNRVAKASALIPEPVPLEDVIVSKSVQSDTMYVVTAYFDDPSGYHRFFTMVEGKNTMYLPSVLSGQSATNRAGAVSVMRGWDIYDTRRMPLYRLGETVRIKFCAVEEIIWQYWDCFDAISTIGTNGFFPISANPPTNMTGAYGYWAGYGATYATVTVK
ncbi:MAG: DUF4249 family protein [Bacteroidales bacterium]|nr:DUF4249 family protein [Bacteroidales bacterium]